MIEVLLAYGADPYRKDRHGRTARDIAAARPYPKVVRALDEGIAARAARQRASNGKGLRPGK